jgi:hypothetical protein
MIYIVKREFLAVNASYVGLILVSCLFLSFLLRDRSAARPLKTFKDLH